MFTSWCSDQKPSGNLICTRICNDMYATRWMSGQKEVDGDQEQDDMSATRGHRRSERDGRSSGRGLYVCNEGDGRSGGGGTPWPPRPGRPARPGTRRGRGACAPAWTAPGSGPPPRNPARSAPSCPPTPARGVPPLQALHPAPHQVCHCNVHLIEVCENFSALKQCTPQHTSSRC